MAKIRRGGYVFLSWKGDHSPRHVHVYKDEEFVVKWDLENDCPMKGAASLKLQQLLQDLQQEGLL